jgi:hypothetical protein
MMGRHDQDKARVFDVILRELSRHRSSHDAVSGKRSSRAMLLEEILSRLLQEKRT